MSRLLLFGNLGHAWVLLAILAAAFAAQFADGVPPCPLCVMQRIGFLLAALGPCNLLLAAEREGLTARAVAQGAGMVVLGSLLGAAISIRQVLLHILPGDPGFGSPVLGYHLYTWAAVAFACSIAAAGAQLLALRWVTPAGPRPVPGARATALAVAAMLLANILSVVAEAGFAWRLPDNPTRYLIFG